MHLLLTNDDGWEAPGLEALRRACAAAWPLADIRIVAPEREASQVGHRVTTHGPLRVRDRGNGVHSVDGTPADCVRLALAVLLPWRPDWVISGINAGGNMGHDIPISGTVAAAREAAYHGVPSAAVSHFLRSELALDWPAASGRAVRALEGLFSEPLDDGAFWNVNLPHVPPEATEPRIRHALPERQPLEITYEPSPGEAGAWHYRGRYHQRPHAGESDVAVCFGGDISVSRLRV